MTLRTTFAAALLVPLAVVGVAACGDDASTSGSSDITVTSPWARTSPAGATTGAAYFTITSKAGDSLTGVSVPADIAKTAEMHQTMTMGGDSTMAGMSSTTSGGEMQMSPVGSVELPAGKAVTFEPGGYHVMLTDLAAPLMSGDSFELTLTLAKAGTVKVSVPVRDDAP